jgi:hypothetical protein
VRVIFFSRFLKPHSSLESRSIRPQPPQIHHPQAAQEGARDAVLDQIIRRVQLLHALQPQHVVQVLDPAPVHSQYLEILQAAAQIAQRRDEAAVQNQLSERRDVDAQVLQGHISGNHPQFHLSHPVQLFRPRHFHLQST